MKFPFRAPSADHSGVVLVSMAFAAAALVLVPSSTVHGFGSEGHLWGGGGVANLHHPAPTAAGWWGPSLQAGAVVAVSDFWRLTADVGASHHFQVELEEEDETRGPHSAASIALGTRYALDVFTYVPYAGLAAAFHPVAPPSESSPSGEWFSLRATLGVDYRINREWSAGAAFDIHAPLSQPTDFPHYSSIRVQAAWHFRWF